MDSHIAMIMIDLECDSWWLMMIDGHVLNKNRSERKNDND